MKDRKWRRNAAIAVLAAALTAFGGFTTYAVAADSGGVVVASTPASGNDAGVTLAGQPGSDAIDLGDVTASSEANGSDPGIERASQPGDDEIAVAGP